MTNLRTRLFALVLLGLLGAGPVWAQRVPSMASAERLVDRGRWEQAGEAFQEIVAAEPGNGRAWFYLAYAQGQAGHLEAAAASNRRAAEFPAYRPTALYNLACSESRLGRLDDASHSLEASLAAGFLDFDLLATDPDLEPLRAKEGIALPPQHDYEELKARNGIRLAYRVQLPPDHEDGDSHPALVVFAPGSGGKRCVDWTLNELLGTAPAASGWIVIVIAAPDRGWINHPAHHALEDLLKKLKKELSPEGDTFHAFGLREGGRVATTYSRMSRKYFATLTVMASTGWGGWDDDELDAFRSTPVRQIVGALDEVGLAEARRTHAAFERYGVDAELKVLEDEGPVVAGLRGDDLLSVVTRGLRSARPE